VDRGGFVLNTDANNCSLGCILQQLQDSELKEIGYASKSFKDAKSATVPCKGAGSGYLWAQPLKCYRHFLIALEDGTTRYPSPAGELVL